MMKSGHEMVKYQRIVVISTNEFDATAGSELLWPQVAERLLQEGREIVVCVPAWERLPPQVHGLAAGLNERFVRSPGRLPIFARLVSKVQQAEVKVWFRRWRERFIMKWKPDLVLISQGGLEDGAPWIDCCRKLGIPYSIVVHLVGDSWWPQMRNEPGALAGLSEAAKVFFVSGPNRRLAERQLAMTFGNAARAWNPYKVSRDADLTWPTTGNGYRLACVGRLGVEHKGQDLLVEALAAERWRERPLTLTFFGDGHDKPYLERLIKLRGNTKLVFGGYKENIEDLWRDYHMLVMPSRYEGLPIALVEAMICSRPAIVTDVGGNGELIDDGATGFLASHANVEALDETLERAWHRREEWKLIGENARMKVLETIPADPVDDFIQQLVS